MLNHNATGYNFFMVVITISGRSLPKTDELRDPGKIARRGHCESHKDTETAMIRPQKKDERRKSSKESDRVEIEIENLYNNKSK